MPMNPRLLRPLATGFNPRSLGGLAWWLDAADASTVTISTGVSEWRDKSGNGRHTSQDVGNNQPAYTNQLNGKNTLTFDGADDRLSAASSFSLGTGGYTAFAVASSDGGFNVLMGGFSFPFISGRTSSSTGGIRHHDGVSALDTATTVYPLGAFFIVDVTISPTERSIAINGRVEATGAGTSQSAFMRNVGMRDASTNYWEGGIAEVLVYDTARDVNAKVAVREYLSKKWGIALS
jgi:hypothetical protein